MDIYQKIINLHSRIPIFRNWEEYHTLFGQVASGRPHHWSLPVLACEAVGGPADQAIPAALAIACSHISIILVDDMLDSDQRGEYKRIGMPATANLACAFQATALAGIFLCEIEANARFSILSDINDMMLFTTFGQYLDTQPPTDEEMYWRIVRTKSSPFFGTALQIGALAGGSNPVIAGQLKDLGKLYGEMIQIHDDLNDAMAVPANPDWIERRFSLPILYAQLVDHPGRSRFIDLCKNITNEGALEEAQSTLIQCGAVSYCVDQLLVRYQKASEILADISIERREKLEYLLEEAIAPVQKLFKAIGEMSPAREMVYRE